MKESGFLFILWPEIGRKPQKHGHRMNQTPPVFILWPETGSTILASS